MKFMECIGKNNPIIQRGHTQRIELMLAGDHMVQGDNYLYHGLSVKRKTPSAPYEMVFTAPIIAGMGASAINRNTQTLYAAALYVDWTLTKESQEYIAGRLRGPVTIKHPYLPDDVTLVEAADPPKDDRRPPDGRMAASRRTQEISNLGERRHETENSIPGWKDDLRDVHGRVRSLHARRAFQEGQGHGGQSRVDLPRQLWRQRRHLAHPRDTRSATR